MKKRTGSDRLVHARAVKKAKHDFLNRPLRLELTRADARYLLELMDGQGHESASTIRHQLLAQAFG